MGCCFWCCQVAAGIPVSRKENIMSISLLIISSVLFQALNIATATCAGWMEQSAKPSLVYSNVITVEWGRRQVWTSWHTMPLHINLP